MASVTCLYSTNFGPYPYTFGKKTFHPFLQLLLQIEKAKYFFFHMLFSTNATNLGKNLEFSYLCARFKDRTVYEDYRGTFLWQQHQNFREAEAEIS
jgi:hypothetical protein